MKKFRLTIIALLIGLGSVVAQPQSAGMGWGNGNGWHWGWGNGNGNGNNSGGGCGCGGGHHHHGDCGHGVPLSSTAMNLLLMSGAFALGIVFVQRKKEE